MRVLTPALWALFLLGGPGLPEAAQTPDSSGVSAPAVRVSTGGGPDSPQLGRATPPSLPPRHLPAGDPVVRRRIDAAMLAFYAEWGDRPAWGVRLGRPHEAVALLAELDRAHEHGLVPADYRTADLHGLVRRAMEIPRPPADSLRSLEQFLCEAFLTYATHLSSGRVDTSAVHTIWKMPLRKVKVDSLLVRVLARETPVRAAFEACAPPSPQYAALRAALPRYRALAETTEWPTVPDGKSMKPDMAPDSARVVALERRLRLEGYVDSVGAGGRYDDRMVEAVKRFQERHGLEIDGAVGPRTLQALNLTPAWRARQIEVNLERWRWMPAHLPERRVQVQIPAYRLELVDGGRVVSSMRVIVGKDDWETPVFTDTMRYVVLNPMWNVPRSIAQEEILEKAKADSTYLLSGKFEVFAGYARDAEAVDPATVDWASYRGPDLPYRIRQKPGAGNPLGRIKFMFPNRFNVYLHDTSNPNLFRKGGRGLSHGCIRIEKPLDLAEFVFPGDETWTRERFEREFGRDKERIVSLKAPVPVYILYFTAAVNEAGEVEFYTDVYGIDRELDRRLAAVSAGGI